MKNIQELPILRKDLAFYLVQFLKMAKDNTRDKKMRVAEPFWV
jgi:hypothetical protein